MKDTKHRETLTVATPQRVPKQIAVCPECGGGLWWQFTTKDWLRDMHLDCEDDDWEDEDTGHRNWQADWQPVLEKVRQWLAARLSNEKSSATRRQNASHERRTPDEP
jgi:hypothetical protein